VVVGADSVCSFAAGWVGSAVAVAVAVAGESLELVELHEPPVGAGTGSRKKLTDLGLGLRKLMFSCSSLRFSSLLLDSTRSESTLGLRAAAELIDSPPEDAAESETRAPDAGAEADTDSLTCVSRKKVGFDLVRLPTMYPSQSSSGVGWCVAGGGAGGCTGGAGASSTGGTDESSRPPTMCPSQSSSGVGLRGTGAGAGGSGGAGGSSTGGTYESLWHCSYSSMVHPQSSR
jgi:hypothetical protein